MNICCKKKLKLVLLFSVHSIITFNMSCLLLANAVNFEFLLIASLRRNYSHSTKLLVLFFCVSTTIYNNATTSTKQSLFHPVRLFIYSCLRFATTKRSIACKCSINEWINEYVDLLLYLIKLINQFQLVQLFIFYFLNDFNNYQSVTDVIDRRLE